MTFFHKTNENSHFIITFHIRKTNIKKKSISYLKNQGSKLLFAML